METFNSLSIDRFQTDPGIPIIVDVHPPKTGMITAPVTNTKGLGAAHGCPGTRVS